MKQAMGVVGAVIGAAVGFGGWLILMWVFSVLCTGVLNWLACGGLGGPSAFDLLLLPVAVIGGAVTGYGMGSDTATGWTKR